MTKRKPKSEHKRVGRPTVMTKEVIAKLLHAFARSYTDLEACIYAGISKDSLYEYIKSNPKFSDQKELLKSTPSIKAKENLLDKLDNQDTNVSLWRLERKNREEFGTKQEIDLKATTEIQHTVDVGKVHEILGNLGYSKKS